MAIKFDDFLSKKKEPAQVLDLSRVKVTSKEEFKKYFDRIPEYKIKKDKVLPESVKIRDKDFGLTPSRREARVPGYSYLDPTPPDMKGVHLVDLCPVSIDWKMLTTLRPKLKQDEDMFSRLVQLGKLDLKFQQYVKRSKLADWVRRTKNPRSSIVETRVLSCKDCGEDFCDGSVCNKLIYDNFFRIQESLATGVVKDAEVQGGKDADQGGGKKQRRRGRTRTRRRKPRKNSIFNRPATRGCSRDHSKRERQAEASRSPSASRAKSAPRLSRARRSERSPHVRPPRRSGYASSSGFSTQSDTESPQRKVEFAKGVNTARPSRAFYRSCSCYTSSHSVQDEDETTSRGSDSSPSPERADKAPEPADEASAVRKSRRPATIHLELDIAPHQSLAMAQRRQRFGRAPSTARQKRTSPPPPLPDFSAPVQRSRSGRTLFSSITLNLDLDET